MNVEQIQQYLKSELGFLSTNDILTVPPVWHFVSI